MGGGINKAMDKQSAVSQEQLTLLHEVISKCSPESLAILDHIGESPLTSEQREELREIIWMEFCNTGLREDSEPNERGLVLEGLIDMLGHL